MNARLGAENSPRYSVSGRRGLAKGRSAALSEGWGAQNVPRNRNQLGKCRNAAGGRTVCAAETGRGGRIADIHSQPAAVSITLYSTPGVRP